MQGVYLTVIHALEICNDKAPVSQSLHHRALMCPIEQDVAQHFEGRKVFSQRLTQLICTLCEIYGYR